LTNEKEMKKLILSILKKHRTIGRVDLLMEVNKTAHCSERDLRQHITDLIQQGEPIQSSLQGYSIVKSWSQWRKADAFLTTYIKKLQARRTRLKKNVNARLVRPQIFA